MIACPTLVTFEGLFNFVFNLWYFEFPCRVKASFVCASDIAAVNEFLVAIEIQALTLIALAKYAIILNS